MDTAALKTFAPAVRRQLIEAVTRKLDFVLSAQTPDYLTTFAPQVRALRKLAEADRVGLIERVAYTWFNRFAALRYLDAKGWHPFRARVLTPAIAEETQPELLKLIRNGTVPEELRPHTNPDRLNDLLDGRIPSPDPQGEVYRHLVLAACRFYNALLPDLFERLDDATELLLPDDLLTEHSVVQGFRREISDEDCAEVEILGWLYQYYISEKKDEVMARKKAVPTEDIPAVTQLFTPHWIVRYLVENSLGRLWLLNRPGSKLREHMPYYIEGDAETDFMKIAKPEEIRVLDPAIGSGHLLTYAFDLLTLIYEEEGYAPAEIPLLILRHNLYGLDICPRAAQLAELSLVFKAREKSRRFFQPEHLVRPHIIELRDVRFAENELREYVHALGLGDLFNPPVLKLLHQFEEAKNFGSLIQPCLDEQAIANARGAIERKNPVGQLFLRETHLKILRVLEQAEALTQRYHVVVANPPYMTGGMNGQLSAMVTANFSDTRSDLSATFITRSRQFCLPTGQCGLVTMHSWMFLPTLADFRKGLLSSCRIFNLAHHGIGAFPTLNSKVVQTVAFVFSVSTPKPNDAPICFRLLDYDPVVKERQLRAREKCFANVRQIDFSKIEGWPLAYWLSEAIIASFKQSPIRSKYTLKEGLGTRNDPRFLRCFWEVDLNRTRSEKDAKAKWIRTDKAGAARKWYGNHYSVMNWENDGFEIKNYRNPDGTLKSRPQNTQFFFRQAVTWGKVGTISKTFRFRDSDLAFNDAAPSAFGENLPYLLALLNSKVFEALLDVQGDTMNVTLGVVGILPFIALERENEDIATNSQECVTLARADWDNFETSWDFRDQPLLRPNLKGATLQASWQNWEAQSIAAINRMQELETENNRLFIAAYGLEGELHPEVSDAQITLLCNPANRYKKKPERKKRNVGDEEVDSLDDFIEIAEEALAYAPEERSRLFRADTVREFLSYAVGCMMGRYSPDQPGLILANASDTLREFLAKVGRTQDQLTYVPDEDGIIPVLDGEWFEDDIVARIREFLRATFGDATLRENIRFIEDSLGKDLRKYFLTDFYKDHLQTYKKRPIYWLVQSPKKGFNALLYLHRYSRDMMNLVLNRYLREYQVKLRNRIEHLAHAQINESIKPSDKTAARKESDRLTKILRECEEWERQTILPLAQQRIELDLDDGVKTNYLKLGEALAPIPGLAAAEE